MANLLDLSQREIDILRLVLQGRTNKAIAAEFWIAEKTVEFHLNRIFTKIGVRTRVKAGLWALQQGLEASKRIRKRSSFKSSAG